MLSFDEGCLLLAIESQTHHATLFSSILVCSNQQTGGARINESAFSLEDIKIGSCKDIVD
jgi:hypothetical protein